MTHRFLRFLALAFTGLSAAAPAEERLIQAFEGDGFDDWKVEGGAFGDAPVTVGAVSSGVSLEGGIGGGAAASVHGGPEAEGTLTSPAFKLVEPYLAFAVAGGDQPGRTAVQLLIDGEVVKEARGRRDPLFRQVVWNLGEYVGREVRIRLVDGSRDEFGFIAADHFLMTGSAEPRFPDPVRGGEAVARGLKAAVEVPGMTIPVGTRLQVVATHQGHGVHSPTALSIDEQGRIYVTETHRFRHGVEDNRQHLEWYLEDLAAETVSDRAKMYEKWRERVPLDYMTEKSEKVRVLEGRDGQGRAARSEIWADGFNAELDGTAAGVFAYEGTVYLASIPKLWALRDTDGDGASDVREVIQDGFGVRVSFSGHDMNGFALGPDGRIYGTIGDRGFNLTTREGLVYEFPDRGAVFRFDPDGSNFEVVHNGLRNPKEIAFDEFGNGISVDNNSDQGDESRIVFIVEGGDSGWRMEHQALHSHHRQIGLDGRPPNRWMDEKMWQADVEGHPGWMLPPVANLTTGPSGLTYHPGVGFLEGEVGRFLICDYRGAAAVSGIWSFRIEPDGAGMKMVDARRLNWGAAVTDVDYSWDGRLMVTDFITGWVSHEDGRVYEIVAEDPYRMDEAKEAGAVLAEGLEKRSSKELAALLGHGDLRLRTRAQIELTRREDGLEWLTAAAGDGRLLPRLHGVWGLGIIARRGAAARPVGAGEVLLEVEDRRRAARLRLIDLMDDEEPEVRAQAVKALGDAGGGADGVDLGPRVLDVSPRVRMFAALAAAKLGAKDALPQIWQMLVENGGADPYLRHAGSYAMGRLSESGQLAALKTHESEALRLAAVVALGRQGSEKVAEFLADESRKVADEALRTIHDFAIEAGRPMVAALLAGRPEGGRTGMMWRRLLHSAFRVGDGANVARVLAAALDPSVPEAARAEALRLLGTWDKPHPVDQSLGRWSPLPGRDVAVVRGILQGKLDQLLAVEGGLLEAAIQVVERQHLDLKGVSDVRLTELVTNSRLPAGARAKALDLYAARKPAGLNDFLIKVAADPADDLALEAIRMLADAGAPEAVQAVRLAVAEGSARRQQEAWRIAAGLEDASIASLFSDGLARLVELDGKSVSAIELLEAARERSEESVKEALAVWEARLAASKDPLAAWYPSLLGGDAERGAKLFESHPGGQCMRCHMAEHGHASGGNAGPNLAGAALHGDRTFLLESMIVPGAKVADGFGVVSATLKDGRAIGGILASQSGEEVVIDVAGDKQTFARADLASITEPVSAMPPMGFLLKPEEVRDLVAWLATKDAKPPEGN